MKQLNNMLEKKKVTRLEESFLLDERNDTNAGMRKSYKLKENLVLPPWAARSVRGMT